MGGADPAGRVGAPPEAGRSAQEDDLPAPGGPFLGAASTGSCAGTSGRALEALCPPRGRCTPEGDRPSRRADPGALSSCLLTLTRLGWTMGQGSSLRAVARTMGAAKPAGLLVCDGDHDDERKKQGPGPTELVPPPAPPGLLTSTLRRGGQGPQVPRLALDKHDEGCPGCAPGVPRAHLPVTRKSPIVAPGAGCPGPGHGWEGAVEGCPPPGQEEGTVEQSRIGQRLCCASSRSAALT